jgi:hypothetical protein
MSKLTLSRETWRWLLANFPHCSDRFIENLLIIGLNRTGVNVRQLRAAANDDAREKIMRKALKGRGSARFLLYLYRSGDLRLKPLVENASKTLDEKNLELFLKSLFRKKKPGKTEVGIDVPICYLDNTEKLTQLSSSDASKRVSSYLQERGVPYQVSAGAYRKRIERLLGIGVKLLCM